MEPAITELPGFLVTGMASPGVTEQQLVRKHNSRKTAENQSWSSGENIGALVEITAQIITTYV